MAIEVLGVEHIDLTVNDVARSRAFFDKVLGELGFRKFEGADYIHWANAQMTIAIRDASAANRDARFDRYRVGLHHLALRARSRADVDAFHRIPCARKNRGARRSRRVSAVWREPTTRCSSPIPTG